VSQQGLVYVGEPDRIQEFHQDGGFILGWGYGTFSGLMSIAFDQAGNTYVGHHGTVEVFSQSLVSLATLGPFGGPVTAALDLQGDVFVADRDHNQILKFGSFATGTHATSWGSVKARYR
jgi:hypothetical protein